MRRLLQQWLDELRRQELSLSDDAVADADKNLWSVSVPSQVDVDRRDLVAFLLEALEVRRRLVQSQKARPATFYVWHDEMAGQLRFSTARCGIADLPFGVAIDLVDDPEVIVREFFESSSRDGVSWTDLKEAADSTLEPLTSDDGVEAQGLLVWAVELTAGA